MVVFFFFYLYAQWEKVLTKEENKQQQNQQAYLSLIIKSIIKFNLTQFNAKYSIMTQVGRMH